MVDFQSAMQQLPVLEYRERIVQAIQENPFLLIVGETGSGPCIFFFCL
jgi:HrpA-like RNA helicase